MTENQELPDPSIITLKVTATIDVQFKSYGSYELNEMAKEQITIWVKEILNEEDNIPLFVSSSSGEESISKTIKIEVK